MASSFHIDVGTNATPPTGERNMNTTTTAHESIQRIERAIVRTLLTKAIKNGYSIALDNGEEVIPLQGTVKSMLGVMMSVDEETLLLKKDGKKGAIALVYGNTGWDVIHDYTVGLCSLIEPIENKFRMCQ
jgi:hypothetical protein